MSASPTTLGRYTVVRMLAKGGMADLWLARASGLGGFERHVVIKQLRDAQARDPKFVEMFVAEARLAGSLHHHNIIQVQDIGEQDGRPYFAMEYVHGEDVRRLLMRLAERKDKTPLQHVVAIAGTVAAALHHAHEQKGPDRQPLNIVHRDVSPSNILVGYDGNVKVLDFGIAKAALTVTTDAGVRKGKIPYMAPEQCAAKPADRRADVFSLGIVLWELCTVRRLFKGGNEHMTMAAILDHQVPKPSDFRQDLPPGLEAIIMKALSRDPKHRYQTAHEMRLALDWFAAKAGLAPSTSTLAVYMKGLFGERPEPWLVADPGEPAPSPEFDSPPLPVPPPAELPRAVATEAKRLPRVIVESPQRVVEPQAVPIVAALAAPIDAAIAAQAPVSGERALAEPSTMVRTPPPMPSVILGGKEAALATRGPDAESTELVPPIQPGRGGGASAAKWLIGGMFGAAAIVVVGVIATRTTELEPKRHNAAKVEPKPAEAKPSEVKPDPSSSNDGAKTAATADPPATTTDPTAATNSGAAAGATTEPSVATTATTTDTSAAKPATTTGADPSAATSAGTPVATEPAKTVATDPVAKPAPAKPVPAKPDPVKTQPDVAKADHTDAAKPAKPAVKASTKTASTKIDDHKAEVKHPVARTATSPTKPATPPAKTAPPAWDPDALFLKKKP